MNVTVNTQALVAELRLLNRIVPNKPAIAILSHALIVAADGTEGGGLRLHATDMEVALATSCGAQVDMPGVVALPVAKLLALTERFEDADVVIAVEQGKCIVRCGAFASRLQAMPVADFPPPPEPEGQPDKLDGDALRLLISRTRYAISATAQKYVLQAALLTLQGTTAAMVSTDGKRLALATAARAEGGEDRRVVVPAKALDVVAGMPEGDVELTVGQRHLHFAIGGRLVSSRMLNAEFPRYERIIPRENQNVFTADRAQLSAALRRILVVAEDNGAVRLHLNGSGAVELTSASAEVGAAAEAVRVEYSGPEIKACINGEYFLDFLNASSGQTATVALKDASGAALLSDGDDHVGVIMLMRG